MPDRAAVHPVRPQRDDVANRPSLDAIDGFDVTRLVPALRSSRHLQTLLLGHLSRLIHKLCAAAIHSHRLLRKDILAGLDAGAEMRRAKSRRRRQDGIVDAWNRQRLQGTVE